jgi:hypothetical protein
MALIDDIPELGYTELAIYMDDVGRWVFLAVLGFGMGAWMLKSTGGSGCTPESHLDGHFDPCRRPGSGWWQP